MLEEVAGASIGERHRDAVAELMPAERHVSAAVDRPGALACLERSRRLRRRRTMLAVGRAIRHHPLQVISSAW
jgi:RecB family exonuclease